MGPEIEVHILDNGCLLLLESLRTGGAQTQEARSWASLGRKLIARLGPPYGRGCGTTGQVFTTGRQYKFSANLYRTRGHAEKSRKIDYLGDLLTNNNDIELLRRYEALSFEKAPQWAHTQ